MNISARTDCFPIEKQRFDRLLFYAVTGVFLVMPMGTSLPTVCGAAVIAVWIFSGRFLRLFRNPFRLTKRSEPKPDCFFRLPGFRPVIWLIVLPWIGLLYTPDVANLGIQYAQKTYYWIYCFAVASMSFPPSAQTKPKKGKPETMIYAFLLGLAINALVGTAQFSGFLPLVQGKYYSGLERGYSTLSAYLVVGILVGSYFFRNATQKKRRFLFGMLILFYFFHLSILEGRAGYLMFILLSPLIAANLFHGQNKLKIIMGSLALAAMLSLSPVVRDRVALSVEQIRYHLKTDPGAAWGKVYSDKQDRFYMWQGAYRLYKEHPLFGIGTGGYQKALKESADPADPFIAHPHNDFLYMAISFGIPGIIVFGWFFAELIINSRRRRHTPLGYFVLSAGLVLLTGGLFNTYLLDAGTITLLSLITGLQRHLPRDN